MNDQYLIIIDAERSILAPSPFGEGWGGATPRARSDPSLAAEVRGDPQWISALRIDPPERLKSRGHPPEVRHTRNGPPADSARGKPPEIQNFRKWPRAESRMNGHPPEFLNSGKIYFPPEFRFMRKKAEIVRMGKVCPDGFL
jgi:hypothetical protein